MGKFYSSAEEILKEWSLYRLWLPYQTVLQGERTLTGPRDDLFQAMKDGLLCLLLGAFESLVFRLNQLQTSASAAIEV